MIDWRVNLLCASRVCLNTKSFHLKIDKIFTYFNVFRGRKEKSSSRIDEINVNLFIYFCDSSFSLIHRKGWFHSSDHSHKFFLENSKILVQSPFNTTPKTFRYFHSKLRTTTEKFLWRSTIKPPVCLQYTLHIKKDVSGVSHCQGKKGIKIMRTRLLRVVSKSPYFYIVVKNCTVVGIFFFRNYNRQMIGIRERERQQPRRAVGKMLLFSHLRVC